MFFLVNPWGQMDQNTFPFDMSFHKVKSTAQKINEVLHVVLTLTFSSCIERCFSLYYFLQDNYFSKAVQPYLWILHFNLLKKQNQISEPLRVRGPERPQGQTQFDGVTSNNPTSVEEKPHLLHPSVCAAGTSLGQAGAAPASQTPGQ